MWMEEEEEEEKKSGPYYDKGEEKCVNKKSATRIIS